MSVPSGSAAGYAAAMDTPAEATERAELLAWLRQRVESACVLDACAAAPLAEVRQLRERLAESEADIARVGRLASIWADDGLAHPIILASASEG